MKKMADENIKNNVICRTTIIPRMFEKLITSNQIYQYQLSLSVFHWIRPMHTREDFEQTLAHHLNNSRTTFLELPEAITYTKKNGQHNAKEVSDPFNFVFLGLRPHINLSFLQLNLWYAGRNETQLLEDLAQKYELNLKYKFLGPILHDNGTVRKVFRIDRPNLEVTADVDIALRLYSCKHLYGGKLPLDLDGDVNTTSPS